MEIVDRTDKWSEFIIGTVANTCVMSSINDILERTCHDNNRTKEWANPEWISDEEERKPGYVYEENIS